MDEIFDCTGWMFWPHD